MNSGCEKDQASAEGYVHQFWTSKCVHKSWGVLLKHIKEVNYKVVRNIYPTNKYVSLILIINELCEDEEETIIHLFYEYQNTSEIWKKVEE